MQEPATGLAFSILQMVIWPSRTVLVGWKEAFWRSGTVPVEWKEAIWPGGKPPVKRKPAEFHAILPMLAPTSPLRQPGMRLSDHPEFARVTIPQTLLRQSLSAYEKMAKKSPLRALSRRLLAPQPVHPEMLWHYLESPVARLPFYFSNCESAWRRVGFFQILPCVRRRNSSRGS